MPRQDRLDARTNDPGHRITRMDEFLKEAVARHAAHLSRCAEEIAAEEARQAELIERRRPRIREY